jgi:hydrogenase expression/formation protein HypE
MSERDPTRGGGDGPALNPAAWTCPLPLRDHDRIILGHGGGGKLSAELVEHLFLPAFGGETLGALADFGAVEGRAGRLAVSTDSFVVRPRIFPGGSIGELAIHGTVNDVAMSGARPLWMTAGFIVEEGLPMDELGEIAQRMGRAARDAGVTVIAGDTKVVDRGHGDGLYINTTGFGWIPEGVDIRPDRAEPGDVILVSGTLGDHGMAIMSVREGLSFTSPVESDSAPLHELVAALLEVTRDVHVLRDPTRGGLAAALNEIAESSGVGMALDEKTLPVRPEVKAACEILGLDPLHVANEGKLMAIVPSEHAEAALAALHRHPLGTHAAVIGTVTDGHPGTVTARTGIGGRRIVDRQVGEQLPRIC